MFLWVGIRNVRAHLRVLAVLVICETILGTLLVVVVFPFQLVLKIQAEMFRIFPFVIFSTDQELDCAFFPPTP